MLSPAGFEPRVHLFREMMDCRVKSGKDRIGHCCARAAGNVWVRGGCPAPPLGAQNPCTATSEEKPIGMQPVLAMRPVNQVTNKKFQRGWPVE